MMSPVQTIHLSKVWRAERHASGQLTPVGQVFAFNALKLEIQAVKEETNSHILLLNMAVQGLWECWPKRPVLVGYMPGTERTPICRVFLLSKREFKWSNFHEVASKTAGYIETGHDFIMQSQTNMLLWWEPPCTMVALWPELPPTESAGELQGQFTADDRSYRFIHREFKILEDVSE